MGYESLFSLQGKTALVTGGAGFFGRQFVHGLLAFGADVIVIEKPGTSQDSLGVLYQEHPAKISWHEVDLYDQKATDDLYNTILSYPRSVDILVNNAFEFSPRTGFSKDGSGLLPVATHEQIALAFECGVQWALQASQKFGLEMQKRGDGSIINIASPAGVRTLTPQQYEGFGHSPNPPGYGIAKAGLLALTRYTAAFLAPVRVNSLSPGAIPNIKEDVERAGKDYGDEFLSRLSDRMLLRRCGKPEELVGGLIFLASDASSYVTGHNLMIDGGWSAHL